jgi:hypothetical protein
MVSEEEVTPEEVRWEYNKICKAGEGKLGFMAYFMEQYWLSPNAAFE